VQTAEERAEIVGQSAPGDIVEPALGELASFDDPAPRSRRPI
jgi:hypothetical protein